MTSVLPVTRDTETRSARSVLLRSFFLTAALILPAMVVRAESNLASAGLLLGYLIVDVVVALWLAGWKVCSTAAWVVLILGFLAAAVYNFLVCEFLAGRSDETL